MGRIFDMDEVDEYEMEKELFRFLNSEETKKENSIELEICDFYFKAIGKLLGRDEHRSNIQEARRFFRLFRSFSNSWCKMKNDGSQKEMRQLQETLYYRVAYIYRNSPCISSAVAFHFEKFLNRNWIVANKFLKNKEEIRICSIGGGSPSDVVAFVKVLEASVDEDLDIHVTIIDSDKKWYNTCITVLRCLQRFRNTTCKIDFIQYNIRHSLTDEVIYALKNATVISMVKIFSELEVNKKNAIKMRARIFRRICQNVQPGSLVFLLDFYISSLMHFCGGLSGILPEYSLLYEAVNDLYVLDESVVERHFKLFYNEFHGNMCNTAFIVFCRIWLKNPEDLEQIGNVRCVNEKLVQALAKLKKKTRKEQKLELKKLQRSFQITRASMLEDMMKNGCTKKKRAEAIKSAQLAFNEQYKLKEKQMAVNCNKQMDTVKEFRKALLDQRHFLYNSWRETALVEKALHFQAVESLLLSLKKKYPLQPEKTGKVAKL